TQRAGDHLLRPRPAVHDLLRPGAELLLRLLQPGRGLLSEPVLRAVARGRAATGLPELVRVLVVGKRSRRRRKFRALNVQRTVRLSVHSVGKRSNPSTAGIARAASEQEAGSRDAILSSLLSELLRGAPKACGAVRVDENRPARANFPGNS